MEVDKLLKLVQRDIPLESKPFERLGEALGLGEAEVLRGLRELKDGGTIRQISPIYDTRMLGYDSSLVAFRVSPDRLEECARFLNSHPGVSHNYERTHEFNLWFTLAVPPDAPLNLEDTVNLMAQKLGIEEYLILRTVRTFKIGVRLDYESLFDEDRVEPKRVCYSLLTDEEKGIVKVTQYDMPLVERPYLAYAQRLNMEEERLLEKLREFKQRGILRRVSAILHHRKAGFTANAMVVWSVPENRVEEVGTYIASFKGVSHCYQRSTNHLWKYNLFSMVHGRSREEVEEFVRKVSEEVGVRDYGLLYSTREFKKRRIHYFSDEFYRWYEEVNL